MREESRDKILKYEKIKAIWHMIGGIEKVIKYVIYSDKIKNK